MKSTSDNNYNRLISAETARYLPFLPEYSAKTLYAELHAAILTAEKRWDPQKGDLGSWIFVHIHGRLKDLSKKKRLKVESLDAMMDMDMEIAEHINTQERRYK